ncbi:hypothetical protein A6U87_25735 [Rhizobium sp. AC44/96]|uniref:phosphoadenosine phosphosulfate reductase domain-containing protein n=1 Tax=Rhizobium sp. AC44/96 TaxID=1841654 RepID=UPI00080F8826|nr:phosphoadenosine phosphosulfate reductase family protein [Rhizobium sp. AC44/96]OCJ14569.1 hypothetical protein A6U87_25735 [Rhizobium sp. AC44/96]
MQHYKPEEVRALFCDTQFEHPLTYAHVEKLRTLYGNIQIDTVCAGSVEQQALKHGRFPGGGARFCTEELKIWPTKRYAADLARAQGSRLGHKRKRISASDSGGFEIWYGMRLNESTERANRYAGKVCNEVYQPHEVMKKYPQYLGKLGVRFRLAVLDWSEADVLDFLSGEENPLYAQGFPRVGCFPCLASGDKWKVKAFQHDDFGQQQHRKVIRIGQQIGKSVYTSKGCIRSAANDNVQFDGCAVCAI